jgi:hypothetical protein
MGVVYLVVGSSFFFMPGNPSREAAFSWLTAYVSLGWFASLWVIAGLIAMVCAFRPRPKDAAGFIALVFAPGIWVGLFILSAIITGSPLAVVSAVVYGAFGTVPLIVSGMEGPKDRDHREVVI